MLATFMFHMNNGLGRRASGANALDLRVHINGEPFKLRVRPSRGDLFILYEVLAHQAYAIPRDRLDWDKVRVIIDCGANIGITSLYLSNRYPNARIISVEPDPDNFEVLCRNVAKCNRIEPIQAAIVQKAQKVHLTRDRPAYGNIVKHSAVDGLTIEVPGLAISDICEMMRISRIDLLKIDIEGAEQDVFSDPIFLPLVDTIAIELHPPYGIEGFQKAIAPWGFVAEPPGEESCRHAYLAYPRNSGEFGNSTRQ